VQSALVMQQPSDIRWMQHLHESEELPASFCRITVCDDDCVFGLALNRVEAPSNSCHYACIHAEGCFLEENSWGADELYYSGCPGCHYARQCYVNHHHGSLHGDASVFAGVFSTFPHIRLANVTGQELIRLVELHLRYGKQTAWKSKHDLSI
jgi:hypothetical protein